MEPASEENKPVILDLDDDPEHVVPRGQNVALVSFLEPSSIFQKKEAYFFTQFISNLWGQIDTLLKTIEAHFPGSEQKIANMRLSYNFLSDPKACQELYDVYVGENWDKLHNAFVEKFETQTKAVRAFKLRGVFPDMEAAKKHVKKLQKVDQVFNVYAGEVGRWLPWCPPSNAITTEEEEQTEVQKMLNATRANKQNELDQLNTRRITIGGKGTDPVDGVATSTEKLKIERIQ